MFIEWVEASHWTWDRGRLFTGCGLARHLSHQWCRRKLLPVGLAVSLWHSGFYGCLRDHNVLPEWSLSEPTFLTLQSSILKKKRKSLCAQVTNTATVELCAVLHTDTPHLGNSLPVFLAGGKNPEVYQTGYPCVCAQWGVSL